MESSEAPSQGRLAHTALVQSYSAPSKCSRMPLAVATTCFCTASYDMILQLPNIRLTGTKSQAVNSDYHKDDAAQHSNTNVLQ